MDEELLKIYTLMQLAEDHLKALNHTTAELRAGQDGLARDRSALKKTAAEQTGNLLAAALSLQNVGADIRREAQNAAPAARGLWRFDRSRPLARRRVSHAAPNLGAGDRPAARHRRRAGKAHLRGVPRLRQRRRVPGHAQRHPDHPMPGRAVYPAPRPGKISPTRPTPGRPAHAPQSTGPGTARP